MSLDDKKIADISHMDHAEPTAFEEKSHVDGLDADITRVIDDEKAKSYRDVWRTHKKGLLWSIGVSWVCQLVYTL